MKLLGLLSILGFIVFTSARGPQIHRSGIRWYAGNKAVTIMNMEKRGGGSGSHIIAPSGKTYILTNKHVCNLADKKGNLMVKSSSDTMNRFYKRKVIKKYDRHDLCIIEPLFKGSPGLTTGSKIAKGELVGVFGHPRLVPLSLFMGEMIGSVDIELVSKVIPIPRNPKKGKKGSQDMTTIVSKVKAALAKKGYMVQDKIINDAFKNIDNPIPKFDPKTACPKDQKFVRARGFLSLFAMGYCIETLETNMYTASTRPGSSGSPVLNFWGNLVGVTFAGNPEVSTESFMVPLKFVRDFLSDK